MAMSVSRRGLVRAGVVTAGAAVGVSVVAESSAGTADPADGGWLSVVDCGAVGDGNADDTAAIQAAFDKASVAAAKGVYLPARTYRVTRELVASNLTDFVISGYGATLALTDAAPGGANGGNHVLRLTNCHRFRVLGLAVHDVDRTQTYVGISVDRSSAGVIDSVHVRDVKWTGISVFDTVPATSTDVAVTNCVVEGTRFGISSNGADVRIIGNHVAMYWPSTTEAAAKNKVWSQPSDYFDGIMVLAGADRTVVANNTVTECGQAGMYIQACTNLVVTGNTVTGCQLRGIEVDGGTDGAVGVAITDNVVTDCVGQINLVRARDVIVVGNRTQNTIANRAVSCIAVNTGTTSAMVVGNHADQAHPTFPAMYVDPNATDVTMAWNAVNAHTAYQAPPDTVLMYRSAAGQIKTTARFIAVGGIGVGNSLPASKVGGVVRKVELFSSTGVSLGWIPVYGSIT